MFGLGDADLPCYKPWTSHCQWDFRGPPIMGPLYGKFPILFPIRIPKHNSMGNLPQRVPLLGGPENTLPWPWLRQIHHRSPSFPDSPATSSSTSPRNPLRRSQKSPKLCGSNPVNKSRIYLGRRRAQIVPKHSMYGMYGIPSRELTYPTLGKGKSSSKCHFWGIC